MKNYFKTFMETLMILLTASLLIAIPACEKRPTADGSPTTTVGTDIDDSVITLKVKAALVKDDRTSALDIAVTTVQGHVTLNGSVSSKDQIDISTALAKQVEGVKSVDNQLEVVAPKISSDEAITTQLKAALANEPQLKGQEISVSTKNGNVELGGTVDSHARAARAVELAQRTPGVKIVANRIKVGLK